MTPSYYGPFPSGPTFGLGWTSILVVVLLAVLVAALTARAGVILAPEFNRRNVLRTYLRAGFLAGIAIGLAGASMVVAMGFGQVYGRDFTYPRAGAGWSGYSPCPKASASAGASGSVQAALPPSDPNAATPPPTFANPPTLSTPIPIPRPVPVPVPFPAPQLGPATPNQISPCLVPAAVDENAPKRELTGGLTLLLVGMLLAGLHRYLTAQVETLAERAGSGLAAAEVLAGTVVLGALSIPLVAVAAYLLAQYVVIAKDSTIALAMGGPGHVLAAAIVFALAWGSFLWRAVTRIRGPRPVAPAPPNGPEPEADDNAPPAQA